MVYWRGPRRAWLMLSLAMAYSFVACWSPRARQGRRRAQEVSAALADAHVVSLSGTRHRVRLGVTGAMHHLDSHEAYHFDVCRRVDLGPARLRGVGAGHRHRRGAAEHVGPLRGADAPLPSGALPRHRRVLAAAGQQPPGGVAGGSPRGRNQGRGLDRAMPGPMHLGAPRRLELQVPHLRADGVAGEYGRGGGDDGTFHTFFSLAPSYHGCRSRIRRWIDHIAIPERRLCDVAQITMLRASARHLQLIPDRVLRDHIPMKMRLRGGLSYTGTAERGEPWHRDAIAAELSSGVDRAAIVSACEDALMETAPDLAERRWDTTPMAIGSACWALCALWPSDGSACGPRRARRRGGAPSGRHSLRSAEVSSFGAPPFAAHRPRPTTTPSPRPQRRSRGEGSAAAMAMRATRPLGGAAPRGAPALVQVLARRLGHRHRREASLRAGHPPGPGRTARSGSRCLRLRRRKEA